MVDEPPPETPATSTPATTLTITVAPVPAGIPEYDRSDWRHWTDADGDCQDAQQEELLAEALVEVTYKTEKERNVARRWTRDVPRKGGPCKVRV